MLTDTPKLFVKKFGIIGREKKRQIEKPERGGGGGPKRVVPVSTHTDQYCLIFAVIYFFVLRTVDRKLN